MAEEEKISLNSQDELNIRNLFTNSLIAHVQDRSQLRELLDDEQDLIDKISSIQNERDSLILEKIEFLKNIKKLKSNVGKSNK